MADAQDLKSCDPYRSYRFDSGLRHQRKFHKRRGVEQLVARRAHNPEVAGSNPAPATKKKKIGDSLSFLCMRGLGLNRKGYRGRAPSPIRDATRLGIGPPLFSRLDVG